VALIGTGATLFRTRPEARAERHTLPREARPRCDPKPCFRRSGRRPGRRVSERWRSAVLCPRAWVSSSPTAAESCRAVVASSPKARATAGRRMPARTLRRSSHAVSNVCQSAVRPRRPLSGPHSGGGGRRAGAGAPIRGLLARRNVSGSGATRLAGADGFARRPCRGGRTVSVWRWCLGRLCPLLDR
jgi:hypothetical protein